MRIYKIDENGANKKDLYIFKPTENFLGGLASDGENLYFMMQQMDADWRSFKKKLVALNTVSCQITVLGEYEVDDFLFGASNKNLYTKSIQRANDSNKNCADDKHKFVWYI